MPKCQLSDSEITFIIEAKKFLENKSVLMEMADMVGKPVVWTQKVLPEKAQKSIQKAVHKSLYGALNIAMKSLHTGQEKEFNDSLQSTKNHRILHASATGLSGAIGGFFGGAGLIVELPITTSLIMRNIASIASEFGFSQKNPQTPLECLYVFTLGSRKSDHDNDIDSAYYSSRLALAAALTQGAEFIASHSAKVVLDHMSKGTAPVLLNFIQRVAMYFEIVVTEKILAGALPLVGSLGGATINIAFTDYFGQAAKYHFGLLYLEQKYGKDMIQEVYSHTVLKT